jgi:hypothetical protein
VLLIEPSESSENTVELFNKLLSLILYDLRLFQDFFKFALKYIVLKIRIFVIRDKFCLNCVMYSVFVINETNLILYCFD